MSFYPDTDDSFPNRSAEADEGQTQALLADQRIEEARALLMAEFADDEITEGHYTTAFDGYLEEQLDRFGLSAGEAYDTAAEIVADFHAYMKWGYK